MNSNKGLSVTKAGLGKYLPARAFSNAVIEQKKLLSAMHIAPGFHAFSKIRFNELVIMR